MGPLPLLLLILFCGCLTDESPPPAAAPATVAPAVETPAAAESTIGSALARRRRQVTRHPTPRTAPVSGTRDKRGASLLESRCPQEGLGCLGRKRRETECSCPTQAHHCCRKRKKRQAEAEEDVEPIPSFVVHRNPYAPHNKRKKRQAEAEEEIEPNQSFVVHRNPYAPHKDRKKRAAPCACPRTASHCCRKRKKRQTEAETATGAAEGSETTAAAAEVTTAIASAA